MKTQQLFSQTFYLQKTTVKSPLKILWGGVHLNTKLRKIWNGGYWSFSFIDLGSRNLALCEREHYMGVPLYLQYLSVSIFYQVGFYLLWKKIKKKNQSIHNILQKSSYTTSWMLLFRPVLIGRQKLNQKVCHHTSVTYYNIKGTC